MQEMQGTQAWSLGREDPLEKEMATHSSILTWEIPWTEEPGRLQSRGSQKSWTWLSIETETKSLITWINFLFFFLFNFLFFFFHYWWCHGATSGELLICSWTHFLTVINMRAILSFFLLQSLNVIVWKWLKNNVHSIEVHISCGNHIH